MELLSKIASGFRWIRAGGASPKKIINPPLSTPDYLNRHPGATFLVLGNGPSLGAHRKEIHELIEKHRPIVMGANNITGFIYPDYHAFTNRRRLINYAHTIDSSKSKVLVGVHLPGWVIEKHYEGAYERIMYVNDHDRAFDICDGIIMASCRTVSVLLIGVALVMGGERVFVAGLDGYGLLPSKDEDVHYYKGERDHGPDVANKDTYLMQAESMCSRFLDEISHYMTQQGLEPFKIVTPTTYSDHYQDIQDYLLTNDQ